MNTSAPADIEAIANWLLSDEARRLPSGPAVMKELCLRLVAAGMPLARGSIHVRTLHPQVYGLGFYWHCGLDDIEIFYARHGVRDSDMYQQTPLRLIFDEGVSEVRQSLEQPDETFAFERFVELKAEGLTDYLAFPLNFSDGKSHATTWSTDRPGGFKDEEVDNLRKVLPIFSLLIEIHLNRRIAINLLNTYVGHQAGERILSGQITRGAGETIPAAIWFSDLRGFTKLSETRERDELLDLLNQSFDCLATPVTERGGEILKFIGDAVLAIFPLEEERACQLALEAAIEAQKGLDLLNQSRVDIGAPPLSAGIALHVGEVMYGNIGSAERLDFTVIGPAVNLASRVEGLCKTLGQSILLSDQFADRCTTRSSLRSLGRHSLRGIALEVELFTPECSD